MLITTLCWYRSLRSTKLEWVKTEACDIYNPGAEYRNSHQNNSFARKNYWQLFWILYSPFNLTILILVVMHYSIFENTIDSRVSNQETHTTKKYSCELVEKVVKFYVLFSSSQSFALLSFLLLLHFSIY